MLKLIIAEITSFLLSLYSHFAFLRSSRIRDFSGHRPVIEESRTSTAVSSALHIVPCQESGSVGGGNIWRPDELLLGCPCCCCCGGARRGSRRGRDDCWEGRVRLLREGLVDPCRVDSLDGAINNDIRDVLLHDQGVFELTIDWSRV